MKSTTFQTINLLPKKSHLEELDNPRNQIQDNYGICPRAYEGCRLARGKYHFDKISSRSDVSLSCILNDSGIMDIPRYNPENEITFQEVKEKFAQNPRIKHNDKS